MKKRVIAYFLLMLTVFVTAACGTKSESKSSSKPEKGNCTAIDCIKNLKSENTVEEINKVIGFEGKLIDEKNNVYSWEIGKDDKLIATYYNGDKATIEAKYVVDELKNDKIDFSSYSEIQSLLKKGESLTYEEFNKKVNGTGLLYLISPSNKKYVWVNKKGEYLNANFSNSTGKCTFVTGRLEKKE
ncbi:MAG: hypothetical protein IJH20_02090 [Bacilli bacterium]|nr:hypothetical protein [Bacilli bacterium]